jgi:hypothetical protein
MSNSGWNLPRSVQRRIQRHVFTFFFWKNELWTSYLTQAPSPAALWLHLTQSPFHFYKTSKLRQRFMPSGNVTNTQRCVLGCHVRIQWEHSVDRSFIIKLGMLGTTVFHSSGDNGVAGNGNVCLNSTRMLLSSCGLIIKSMSLALFRPAGSKWNSFQPRIPGMLSRAARVTSLFHTS